VLVSGAVKAIAAEVVAAATPTAVLALALATARQYVDGGCQRGACGKLGEAWAAVV